jgi:phenylacetate-CoA ligase
VVTDLNNRALPLLRYRIMDRAIRLGECSCGRGFPVLGSIQGRVYDQVVAPDGRFYHGEFFMYLFEDLRDSGAHFERFRVIQTARDRLEVEIQTPDIADGALVDAVADKLARQLDSMHVEVRLVTEIRLPPSGKLRLVENRVPVDSV